jgi:hypothetical protein
VNFLACAHLCLAYNRSATDASPPSGLTDEAFLRGRGAKERENDVEGSRQGQKDG